MSFMKFPPLSFFVLVLYFLFIYLMVFFNSLEILWILMELTTFLFMGYLITAVSFNSITESGAASYFITQSVLSMALLFLILLLNFSMVTNVTTMALFLFVALLKMGNFPFSAWYYSSVLLFPKSSFMLAISFQKLPVLFILNQSVITFHISTLVCGVISTFLLLNLMLIGTLSTTSFSDVRSLLISTSIANNVWFTMAAMTSLQTLILFTMVYWILLLMSLNAQRSVSFLSILMLSGLPPFPIFFMKLLIVYSVLSSSFTYFNSFIYLFVLMLGSLLVSFSYIRNMMSRLLTSF